MAETFVNSDREILEFLRDHDSLSVAELAELSGVTATAVRQRLTRLMFQELIERIDEKHGRGRPQHRYSLTASGRRQAGENFGDLAVVLWEEICAIEDESLKRKLVEGIAQRLAKKYASQVEGVGAEAKMASIAALFRGRHIPVSVEADGLLPVLNVKACPYPDLASEDSSICEMEASLFSELLGHEMKLQECTQQGGCSCRFEPTATDEPDVGPP